MIDIIQYCKDIYNNNQFRTIKSNKPTFTLIKNITVFLDQNEQLKSTTIGPSRRVWHVANDKLFVPLCTVCNIKICCWKATFHTYSSFCSKQCSRNSGEEFKKRADTCINIYGFANPRKSEQTKQKIRDHMVKQYGVDNYFKSDEFQKRKSELYINSPIKTNISQNHITDDSILKSNNKEWLYEQHVTLQKPICQIASELGYSDPARIGCRLKDFEIEVQKFYSSVPEKEIVAFIQQLDPLLEIKRNFKLNRSELDIYIPSKNIAIEFDGLYWHCERNGKDKNYHKNKYEKCKNNGIRLINVFEDEYIHSKQLVLHKIQHILGYSNTNKMYARKTNITGINTTEKRTFFDAYHIQQDGPSSINYALHDNNHNIVAVIGFIKLANESYVLNRYATSCNVVGGFTKLLSHFKIHNKWKNIVTFADLRWSEGALYIDTGFNIDKILPPDYSYIINTRRIHKFNFRHKQMAKKLKDYDSQLTEQENMLNHKINKIWDCGKIRFIMENI